MQKLQGKFKNTPRNTSLVPCSVSSGLNKEEIPSDQNIVRTCNNSEENHRKHGPGSDDKLLNVVYVLNKSSKALMPTCQARARRLLKNNKAKVVKRYPFTIQMLIVTGENRQEMVLGIDVGYQKVGVSAISNKQELFSAEVSLRNNIVKLNSERKMYRRNRRNKLWYRKSRFDNRKKHSNWLPPSIQHKVDSHIKIIKIISEILPITKAEVEIAKFDIQKINNPKITNLEYQNGVQKDFENVRTYILFRDNHTCQVCKKSNVALQVHHIETRKTGGDRPDNLITLCKNCHEKYHKGKAKLDVEVKNNFRPETCMSIIRKRIIDELRKKFEVEEIFGYITKSNRLKLKLEKSHINDAFVIAGGNNQKRCGSYIIEQKRRNNRCLQINRKGFSPSIRRKRYPCQPKDLVKIKNKLFEVVGTHCYGKNVIIKNLETKLDLNIKKINWIYHVGGMNFIKPDLCFGNGFEYNEGEI